jgi:DNA helicase-2/ATP-dependent DNA helicase PcrA
MPTKRSSKQQTNPQPAVPVAGATRLNPEQTAAVHHGDGPLHIIAGPGSGKTTVLVARVVRLIVELGVAPGDIFLGTFSEKAARQLRERVTLEIAKTAERTRRPYDISAMYVGTVHSLSQRILEDRDFRPPGTPLRVPVLLDEQAQFAFVSRQKFWVDAGVELNSDPGVLKDKVHRFLGSGQHDGFGEDRISVPSKKQLIEIFNRLSEETFDLEACIRDASSADALIFRLYRSYLEQLRLSNRVDYATLQHAAIRQLDIAEQARPGSARNRFKHVLIDEYQDTNAIQESLVFKLAAGHKNLCVVGDDDQALYRFRGATVENFVRFPGRAKARLGVPATEIRLATNYRSLPQITLAYRDFMDAQTWEAAGVTWRVENKKVLPHRTDEGPEVVVLPKVKGEQPEELAAAAVRRLIDEKKVVDPNQIAFLFPSVLGEAAKKYRAALRAEGIEVYAPRMEPLIFTDEATKMLGVMHQVIGKLELPKSWAKAKAKAKKSDGSKSDWEKFGAWLERAHREGEARVKADPALEAIVARRVKDLRRLDRDYAAIDAWLFSQEFDRDTHLDDQLAHLLSKTPGVSTEAQKALRANDLLAYAARLRQMNQPPTVGKVVARATTGDWTLLDLFYEILGTDTFTAILDEALDRRNEAPAANLAQLSRIIDRFMTSRGPFVRGEEDRAHLQHRWYNGFLYPTIVMKETVEEDELVAFPRGRVPFLTIHQSKGLEFPVVFIPRLTPISPDNREKNKTAFLQTFLAWNAKKLKGAEAREPATVSRQFDGMRLFYVAMSRAENLLVLGPGSTSSKAKEPPDTEEKVQIGFGPVFDLAHTLDDLSLLDGVPPANSHVSHATRTYSFTADFLAYQRCPRHYMLFRQFGFIETRAQTMFFGSLVHATIEDFHRRLIHARRPA